MQERRHPLARRYKVEDVAGHQIVVPVTEDIEDEYLQAHFEIGWHAGDYEYCQAIHVESQRRSITITIP
jgi:hypothetical protein